MYIFGVEGNLVPGQNVVIQVRMGGVPFKLGPASHRGNGNWAFRIPLGSLVFYGIPKEIGDGQQAIGQWVIS